MKRFVSVTMICILLAVAVFAGCTTPTPGPGFCNRGVCIDLSLVEPIQINQPVSVNITILTAQAQSQMPIELDSHVNTDEFDQASWVIDTQANVPVLLSTTVTLREEGYHFIFVSMLPNDMGQLWADQVMVHLTAQGGTINPPTPTNGEPFLEQTQPAMNTETPAPTGTCNFGVCVNLSLVESIQINQPVPVNITIFTEQDQSQMPVRLDSMANSDEFGQKNWMVDTQANVPVRLSTTVTFREEGDHFIFVDALPNNFKQPTGAHLSVHLTSQGGTVISPGGTPTAAFEALYPAQSLIPNP